MTIVGAQPKAAGLDAVMEVPTMGTRIIYT